jgi:hypothetical protein
MQAISMHGRESLVSSQKRSLGRIDRRNLDRFVLGRPSHHEVGRKLRLQVPKALPMTKHNVLREGAATEQ